MDENDEELLRSVALQNAKSIFLARQQAEEALRESEERLRHSNAELARRVAELKKANFEIQDSRRAALNLMEDAIQSRQLIETLNLELRNEITERKRADEAIEALNAQLTSDLAAMTRMQQVSTRLVQLGDFSMLLHEILDAAIEITGANMGNIQLLEGGPLKVVSQRGFEAPFLDFFNAVHDGVAACGTPIQKGERVIVEDVESSPIFAGTPALDVMLAANARAVQSTPLVNRSGRLLGMFSTHYHAPHRPSERELRMLDLLARQAADLIERKQVEEALRTSEERFRTLVSAITDVPWTTDAEGRFVAPQPAWAAYTGQSWDELRDFGWANALHPEDRESIRAVWQHACETRSLYESQGRLWHAPSQQYRYFEARATPLLDPDGSVREWVGTCTDVHKRKLAEEQLRESEERLRSLNADLESRVMERTAELVSTIAQRETLQAQLLQAQKMESIGTLAGGIAHDFNNLLNIIMGYTLLVQHNAHQGKLSDALGVIQETVQRAAALVQQLLAIARKTEIKFEEININAVLEKLKRLLSETFPKTIDIGLQLHLDIPPLSADPNQIHQTLLNLCVNARDAMPDGGKLVLETSIVDGAKLRERFQEAKKDHYICISVADTGTGIHAPAISRIFEPFFTTKPAGQGTGLGLSVVYGIVTNHSGFVDVESEPGQWTTFFIYLPVAQDTHAAFEEEQKLAGNGERAPGNGETVLFVDDEEKQLRLMREFLESEGYRVLVARDGAEAVDLHAQYREEIAVVVLDFGLPKLNGWQAFQRMREINPDLNALFATGFLSPEIEAEMRRGKLAGVINKPYQLDEVLEKISAAVNRRE